MNSRKPSARKGLAAHPTPAPLGGHPGVLVELREIGPEDCDGAGEKYRLRWRYVVVQDGHDPEVRTALRELRRRGLYAGPLKGDELPPPEGATRRGIPPDYAGGDEHLCNARCVTGRPCRAVALANGRCVRHGGMSTGPKTPEGKRRSALNLALARAALAAKRRAG